MSRERHNSVTSIDEASIDEKRKEPEVTGTSPIEETYGNETEQ